MKKCLLARQQQVFSQRNRVQKKTNWCRVAESNHGHGDFQSPALPTELTRHLKNL